MTEKNHDKPPEPPTVKLETVPDWAVKLTGTVNEGFRKQADQMLAFGARLERVEKRMDGVEAIDISSLKDTGERIAISEAKLREIDERTSRHSTRVRGTSENDMKQDSAIASIVTELATVKADVGAVKTNQEKAAEERADTAKMMTEVRDAVVGVVTNKKLIFVGKVLFGIAVAYSAAHGIGVVP